ncbi:Mur ligase domain-containing protein [Oerskovia sp. M15]
MTTFELEVGAGDGAGPGRDVLAGVEIWSVASDNRVVSDGDLFVALPGAIAHGASFASGAIDRGARVVLTDPTGPRSSPPPGRSACRSS